MKTVALTIRPGKKVPQAVELYQQDVPTHFNDGDGPIRAVHLSMMKLMSAVLATGHLHESRIDALLAEIRGGLLIVTGYWARFPEVSLLGKNTVPIVVHLKVLTMFYFQ